MDYLNLLTKIWWTPFTSDFSGKIGLNLALRPRHKTVYWRPVCCWLTWGSMSTSDLNKVH